MKIRQGFVSNSSTTSFLIGIKKDPETCPTCGHTPPNMLDRCQDNVHWESEFVGTGEALVAKLKNNIKREPKYAHEHKEVLKRVRKMLKECEVVFEFELGYHDEYMSKLLNDAVNSGTIVMEETFK